MKKLALAAVLTALGTAAFAGGMTVPMMEPVIVEEAAAGTSGGGMLVPLIALLVIWAAL